MLSEPRDLSVVAKKTPQTRFKINPIKKTHFNSSHLKEGRGIYQTTEISAYTGKPCCRSGGRVQSEAARIAAGLHKGLFRQVSGQFKVIIGTTTLESRVTSRSTLPAELQLP